MKRFLVPVLLLSSHWAFAQQAKDGYAVEQAGAYYLAVPKTLQVDLTRQDSRKLPSCESLAKDLEPMLAAIEQCGATNAKRDEFCKYTSRVVRQKVLGIKSEITQLREADAKQQWKVDVILPTPSPGDYAAMARELAVADEQLPKATSLTSVLRKMEMNTARSKLLGLLAKLDDPEMAQIQLKDLGYGAFGLETTSRAVTCEMLAGNVSLQLESDVTGTFDVPADQSRMAKLWDMKLALDPLLTWKSKQDRYKYIVAGHRLASLEDQEHPDELEKLVLADSELLIDFTASEFKLIGYGNKFSLGQRLPQVKVQSHYTLKQLWDIR